MQNQALFSSKDKSKKLKCRLLHFLFGALRVNTKNKTVAGKIHKTNTDSPVTKYFCRLTNCMGENYLK